MSLTSVNYDSSAVRQETADARNMYSWQADPVYSYRPFPGPLPAGVVVNNLGSAQNYVDAESLLRNQAYVASKNPQYRSQADACFAPYMQAQNAAPLPCVSSDLTPQVNYTSRACDPLSGVTIDRFVPLIHQNAGFMYGASPATFGVDTVAAMKDELARNRQK